LGQRAQADFEPLRNNVVHPTIDVSQGSESLSLRQANVPLSDSASSTAQGCPHVDLFGPRLLRGGHEIETANALVGRTVAILFAASWSEPSSNFLPRWLDAYSRYLIRKNAEVVLVSCETSESAFLAYYLNLPWLAVPYTSTTVRKRLSRRCKHRDLPHLVVVDEEGRTCTRDGVARFTFDPKCKDFPWRPKPFLQAIGNIFFRGHATVGPEEIHGKVLGILFCSWDIFWFNDGRAFAATLAKRYQAYRQKDIPFEVVFCPRDKRSAGFNKQYHEMIRQGGTWLAIPWEDIDRIEDLCILFDQKDDPQLVIVDPTGKVLNADAQSALEADADGLKFPWAVPLVRDLATADGLEDIIALCVFMESASHAQQVRAMRELTVVAARCHERARFANEDPEYVFFAARSSVGDIPSLRKACGLPAWPPPPSGSTDGNDEAAFDGDGVPSWAEPKTDPFLNRQAASDRDDLTSVAVDPFLTKSVGWKQGPNSSLQRTFKIDRSYGGSFGHSPRAQPIEEADNEHGVDPECSLPPAKLVEVTNDEYGEFSAWLLLLDLADGGAFYRSDHRVTLTAWHIETFIQQYESGLLTCDRLPKGNPCSRACGGGLWTWNWLR